MEWNDGERGLCALRKLNIVDCARVFGSKWGDHQSWLGERVTKGGKDGTIQASDGVDAIKGELNRKRVFDYLRN